MEAETTELRHRALADASRRRLLATLAADGPLGVRELAAALGLHANTVRAHVRVLAAAQLVTAERAPASGVRGRPGLVYRAAADERDAASGGEHYRLLAQILTEAVAQADDIDVAAVAEAWAAGEQGAAAGAVAGDDAALGELTALLDRMGFAPRVERDAAGAATEITMVPCPFLELAEQHPEVVCAAHLGLMRGALTEAGARDLRVTELTPFAQPDCCRAALG